MSTETTKIVNQLLEKGANFNCENMDYEDGIIKGLAYAATLLSYGKQYADKNVRLKPRRKKSDSDWVPVKMRRLTEAEELIYGEGYDFIFDSEMPKDGQKILITVNGENGQFVTSDVCCVDDNGDMLYLKSNLDWMDVMAWKPFPKPYKERDKE